MNWNDSYWRRGWRDTLRQGFDIIGKTITELTSTEPVDVDTAKAHLRVTSSSFDTEITSMIKRARMQIEHYINQSLISKRVVLTADIYGEWWLPYGPVVGVEGVSSQESTVGSGIPAFITSTENWNFNQGKFTTTSGYRQQITYTVGYSTVPEDLKGAILAQVYWLYVHRGNELESLKLSTDAMGLADPYRRLEWM